MNTSNDMLTADRILELKKKSPSILLPIITSVRKSRTLLILSVIPMPWRWRLKFPMTPSWWLESIYGGISRYIMSRQNRINSRTVCYLPNG